MRKLPLCCAAALLLGSTLPARAAVIFDYIANPANAQSTNDVAPNTTVTYNIYLRETLSEGSAELVNSTGGLFGAGFYVQLTSGSGSAITAVDFDPSFGFQPNGKSYGKQSQRNYTATRARLSENGSDLVQMQFDSPNTYLAKLGTLTLKATAGTTTFSVSAYRNLDNSDNFGGLPGLDKNTIFITNDFQKIYDADVTNNVSLEFPGLTYVGANDVPINSFTVIVVANSSVPEPSSVIFGWTMGLVGLVAYRRRKMLSPAQL